MMNRLMITAATAALIAGTGLANAQGMGGREGGAAGGAGMQQSAPSAPAASPSAGAPSREGSSEGMKATQSEEKGGMKNQRAQQDMKSGHAGEKSMGEKSAQDTKQDTKADHSKGMTQNEKGATGKDMKAEDERKGNMKAEGRDNNNTAGAKQEERSQTVGQAGAGAKLSTEQRTKITTVIRDQHIAPVTNINFSISVGTRVPRDVGFHPLPAEIVIAPEASGIATAFPEGSAPTAFAKLMVYAPGPAFGATFTNTVTMPPSASEFWFKPDTRTRFDPVPRLAV